MLLDEKNINKNALFFENTVHFCLKITKIALFLTNFYVQRATSGVPFNIFKRLSYTQKLLSYKLLFHK